MISRASLEIVIVEQVVAAAKLPNFSIRSGEMAELVVPWPLRAAGDIALIAHLSAQLAQVERDLAVAEAFDPRASRSRSVLRRTTLSQRVSENAGLSAAVASRVLSCLAIDPEQKPELIPWVERKLIGFEIAARGSEVVLVDGAGLDFDGERRFLEHLEVHLGQGLAIVALRYPVTRSLGPWTRQPISLCPQ